MTAFTRLTRCRRDTNRRPVDEVEVPVYRRQRHRGSIEINELAQPCLTFTGLEED